MDKKKFLWAAISLVIAVLTIWAVVAQNKNFSIQAFLLFLTSHDMRFIPLCILTMCGYFIFEGFSLARMSRILGFKEKSTGVLYGAADVFFSAITPSAFGGQPAAAYFMLSDGIPASAATAMLLINLVMYTLATIAMGGISLVACPELFVQMSSLSKGLIIFGICILFVLMCVFYMLFKKGEILHRFCLWGLDLLEKFHLIRKKEKKQKKLEKIRNEYEECAQLLTGHKTLLYEVFFWNLLQRASQAATACLVFFAADIGNVRVADVWHVQMFAALGSNCIPVPGAMGVADYLLMDGYGLIVNNDELVVNLELICRGMSFYGCILTSGLIVLGGILLHKKRDKKC